MNLKDQLEGALKGALRAGDESSKRTLRMVLAALRNAEIDKRGNLTDSEIYGILQKEIKSRRETITDAQRAGRQNLVSEAEAEIAILVDYLPKALTPEELELLARQAIDEAGATSMREMGQVMKILMPRVQGRAEGSQVNQLVRQLLS